MNYGYKLTTIGRTLLAKCAALEKPLNLSGVAFGSGLVHEGYDLANVHALINYVVDGAIGTRSYKDNRLSFTVQYDSSTHPDTPTFYLNEFMVYAKDPETNEDVSLLYATLGDYKQPIPAYVDTMPPSVWKFPLTVIISDEINVEITAVPGLVTHDELEEAMNNGGGSGGSGDQSGADANALSRQAVFYVSTSEPDIDTLTDGLMLIPSGYSKDCPVNGEYVYIMQLFHGGVTAENNRTQIAFPYSDEGDLGHGIATRSLCNGVWSEWNELAQVRDHKIKTHASLAEIGLTAGAETIDAIAQALGENCELFYATGDSNAKIYPGIYGIAHVVCVDANHIRFQWTDRSTGIDYVGVYCAANTTKWIGWLKVGSDITLDSLGAVAKAGDTMAGTLYASADHQAPGSYLVRNQKLAPAEDEETPDVNGEICWWYE